MLSICWVTINFSEVIRRLRWRTRVMQANEFDDEGKCYRCQHGVQEHRHQTGSDGVRRTICISCPPPTIRMMGDEGSENPVPFFIEGPIGVPVPCYEDKNSDERRENFLPRSPGPFGPHQITFQARSEGLECEFHFSGTAWRVDEVQQLRPGDEVGGSLLYKLQLYWDQEGLCPGCNGRVRFDNMEMDRLTPGAAGGGYTVGNVQLLCSSCNRIKGNRDMEYLWDRRRRQGLLAGC